MSIFGDLVHSVSSVANTVAGGVTSAANTVAGGVTSAANTVAKGVTSAANTVAGGVDTAAHSVAGAAVSAWRATSDEANAVGGAVESAGLTIGTGFVDGANIAAKYAEEGVDVAGQGLVAAGDYVSQHACDIALGSALGGVFVALAADGEEEATMASLAAAAAAGSAAKAEIAVAADAVAVFIVEPIYLIPQVKKAIGPEKATFEKVLAFAITKAATEKPELVVGSGGQFVAGLVIATVTSIVCEGKLPVGGPRLWSGIQ